MRLKESTVTTWVLTAVVGGLGYLAYAGFTGSGIGSKIAGAVFLVMALGIASSFVERS